MNSRLSEFIDFDRGIVNTGNTDRLKKLFKKAENGEKLTIGFIGGSITQGSLATDPDKCYAALVTRWFKEKFNKSEIEYINAGIGGTTSQFGVSRVNEDLLSYEPDFVITEFAVNDENTVRYKETYEGLIRNILIAKNKPALVTLCNVFYDKGTNAEDQHGLLSEYYDLPCLSMKKSVYRAVAYGKIKNREITPDDLHPNDEGHELLAFLVTNFLEGVYSERLNGNDKKEGHAGKPSEKNMISEYRLPNPITSDSYEKTTRLRNMNSTPVLTGFEIDTKKQQHITDTFKNGFLGYRKGDKIEFNVKAANIVCAYRRSVKHPACVATVVVDDDTTKKVILDGNFDETWGDSLTLTTICEHIENREHKVCIEVTEGDEKMVPFYLATLIVSE